MFCFQTGQRKQATCRSPPGGEARLRETRAMCFTKRDVFRHFMTKEELEQEKKVAKVPPPCFPSESSGRAPDRRFVSSSQRGSWRKSLSAPPRKNGSARPSRRETQPRRRMTSSRSRRWRSLCSDLGVRSSRSPIFRCVHPTRCRAAFLCPGAVPGPSRGRHPHQPPALYFLLCVRAE